LSSDRGGGAVCWLVGWCGVCGRGVCWPGLRVAPFFLSFCCSVRVWSGEMSGGLKKLFVDQKSCGQVCLFQFLFLFVCTNKAKATPASEPLSTDSCSDEQTRACFNARHSRPAHGVDLRDAARLVLVASRLQLARLLRVCMCRLPVPMCGWVEWTQLHDPILLNPGRLQPAWRLCPNRGGDEV
jgi:hypothetical protein